MIKINKRIVPIALAVCLTVSSASAAAPAYSTTASAKSYVYVAASGNGECYHISKNCSRMRGRGDAWLKRQRKQRKDRATVPARNATDNVNMKKKRMRNKQR